MKTKLILFTVCALLMSAGSFAKTKEKCLISGNSLTDFGKYQVVKSDNPMMFKGAALETYDLQYENTNASIRVGIVPEKDFTTYIVRSDGFEVEYRCTNSYFGVKKIDDRFRQLPVNSNNNNMDRVNYFAQRVICNGDKSEKELLGLIACYFPSLIHEDYQANLIQQ